MVSFILFFFRNYVGATSLGSSIYGGQFPDDPSTPAGAAAELEVAETRANTIASAASDAAKKEIGIKEGKLEAQSEANKAARAFNS